MAESKNKGTGMIQTRGTFQARGNANGTLSERFFTAKNTKSGVPWRAVNFGLEFDKGKTIYCSINGMQRDKVYFTKRLENGTVDSKQVPWNDRHSFAEDGYSLIGVNLGLKSTIDAKGKVANDRTRLVEFDACDYIRENLNDGRSVFVRGTIEHSEYNGTHQTRFVPNQISGAMDIDFDSEDFKPHADFTQTFVFMGAKLSEDKTKYIIDAKIVNYDSIVDAEFVTYDLSIGRNFVKLKPYTSIKVWGNINVVKDTEEVEDTGCWGQPNNMERVNSPTIRELAITGADPTSIDTETYSEAEMDAAIERMKKTRQAEADFGNKNNGSWGSANLMADDSDDDAGWD